MFRAVRTIAVAIFLLWPILASAQVQIPPGYQIVRVTETPYAEQSPRMNSHGQIVFTALLGGGFETGEIFLYDGRTGELTQITDDMVADGQASINDDGVIVWVRAFGSIAGLILRTPDGQWTLLNDLNPNVLDYTPNINNAGQVVWDRSTFHGCQNADSMIMFFDGSTTRAITTDDRSNQSPEINDAGEIVWTEYDFCPGGLQWRSLIKLYRDGQTLTLSEPGWQVQSPTLNNAGVCAWSWHDPIQGRRLGIQKWDNGALSLLTDWGVAPHLNDRGDVLLARWHESNGTWHAWLLRDGVYYQLTDGASWNGVRDINVNGEACWEAGPPGGPNDVVSLLRLPSGDLNCDGSVDAFDVEPFVRALLDPDGYAVAHPDCDFTLADVNGDGTVDAFDIEPFVALLAP
jgi:hypothetical protein